MDDLATHETRFHGALSIHVIVFTLDCLKQLARAYHGNVVSDTVAIKVIGLISH